MKIKNLITIFALICLSCNISNINAASFPGPLINVVSINTPIQFTKFGYINSYDAITYPNTYGYFNNYLFNYDSYTEEDSEYMTLLGTKNNNGVNNIIFNGAFGNYPFNFSRDSNNNLVAHEHFPNVMQYMQITGLDDISTIFQRIVAPIFAEQDPQFYFTDWKSGCDYTLDIYNLSSDGKSYIPNSNYSWTEDPADPNNPRPVPDGVYETCDILKINEDPDVFYTDFLEYYYNNPIEVVANYEPFTIGNQVFEDVNKNGAFDAGDTPIPNIEIDLYNDVNQDGVLDSGDTLLKTTSTGSDGKYEFKGGLTLGDKYIIVPKTDLESTVSDNSSLNDNISRDKKGYPITLTKDNYKTVGLLGDFGFVKPVVPTPASSSSSSSSSEISSSKQVLPVVSSSGSLNSSSSSVNISSSSTSSLIAAVSTSPKNTLVQTGLDSTKLIVASQFLIILSIIYLIRVRGGEKLK